MAANNTKLTGAEFFRKYADIVTEADLSSSQYASPKETFDMFAKEWNILKNIGHPAASEDAGMLCIEWDHRGPYDPIRDKLNSWKEYFRKKGWWYEDLSSATDGQSAADNLAGRWKTRLRAPGQK